VTAAFDKLARPVQKWVRAQGWSELRQIQADAAHVLFDNNNDLVVSATTAGGKTEAAFLPLISQVLDDPAEVSGFDLVYIGPLKALITDQSQRLKELCREVELPVIPWHGDISSSVKSSALKTPRGVLLITPESLEALFIRRGLEISRLFGATRAIVIDELHTVLDTERGIQVRSLLTRLELALKRSIRRVGLSATLGDMQLACAYLRPDAPGTVQLVEAVGGGAELLLQLRGYVSGPDGDRSTTSAVAAHLFENLRGSDNLVFAGARQKVEIYADRLRKHCDDANLPQEFYAHHASLSRDHRDFVEKRLKDANQPTTAICTSTLELGIDIGDVTCVAQVGAPFTVASLRQRLGRSGRVDRLRLDLIRAIAMIELLLEKWCEPPRSRALHLSTLVHQILSLIAERGGLYANRLFHVLCQEGPFREVDEETFLSVLRALGRSEIALIEQASDGLLLLGGTGEKIVEHYSFYAVFQTKEEFRLIADGKELGTMPVNNVISSGMTLIFSGRRWVVKDIHKEDRVILVKPAREGKPPVFGGEPGVVHDIVVGRMFDILEGNANPSYMDKPALKLLEEARFNYKTLNLAKLSIVAFASDSYIVVTRHGTIKTNTLALALVAQGFRIQRHDGLLIVENDKNNESLHHTLENMANALSPDIFSHAPNLEFEKFHRYLTYDLQKKDALSHHLDMESLPLTCVRLLDGDPAKV